MQIQIDHCMNLRPKQILILYTKLNARQYLIYIEFDLNVYHSKPFFVVSVKYK